MDHQPIKPIGPMLRQMTFHPNAALDEVIRFSFGLSLVALNRVRAVRVSDNAIEVDLVMNCPGCPAGEVALASAQRTLQALNPWAVCLTILPQVWVPPWK